MTDVVGVKFKEVGKMYYFSPGEEEVRLGDEVIVETARGLEFGTICRERTSVDESELVAPLKSIIRKATDADRKKHEENLAKKDALWQGMRELCPAVYRRMRYRSANVCFLLPGKVGRDIDIFFYKLAKRIYKFS